MKWYDAVGTDNDVIIGTEIRISRNLSEYCFSDNMSEYARSEMSRRIVLAMGNFKSDRNFYVLDMASLIRKQKISLAERRIIPTSFVSAENGSCVILSDDESISICVGGEEHILIRVCLAGDSGEECYNTANEIDEYLNTCFAYAFNEKFGYLFSNPALCGTGMTVTSIMYLPGLSKLSTLRDVAPSAQKLGISIRGIFGTENNQIGDIYAVTNNLGMGIEEAKVIENFNLFVRQLATGERNSSESFAGDISATDKITRSVDILAGARLLSTVEMLEILSWVRMGMNMGLVKGDSTKINSCIFSLQPATLSVMGDKMLDVQSRDELRAEIIKKKFC